jgi:hypothetical protein
LAFKYLDFARLFQNLPLKIRGVRGVMKITPFIPLTLRGTAEGRGRFGIEAFRFFPA